MGARRVSLRKLEGRGTVHHLSLICNERAWYIFKHSIPRGRSPVTKDCGETMEELSHLPPKSTLRITPVAKGQECHHAN
jgi:hypothetical protein